MFGSNGQDRKLDGGIIERFTRRNPDNHRANAHIKSVMNPRMIDHFTSPHFPIEYIRCVNINEHGKIISKPYLCFNPENTVENLQINHYFTKSREEFSRKIQRGKADLDDKRPMTEFDLYQQDVVEDLLALNLFRIKHRIHREKRSTLADLESMFSNENQTLEELLLCFHRAKSIQNEQFMTLAISKILARNIFKFWEAQLLIDALPEIISARTEFTHQMIERGISCLEFFTKFMRHHPDPEAKNWNHYSNFSRQLQILKSFI